MQRFYSILVSLALGLALVVIVLGAYTRLSDAGLGCPDWPGCYGHLSVPEQVEEDVFQRPLEAGKAWKEMIHRYAAGALGLLILGIFLLSLFGRHYGKVLPAILLGTVVFQAALGMWTVTLLLSPVVVTAHLLGGFTTLGLLWLLWLRAHGNHRRHSLYTPALGYLRLWGAVALMLVVGQIFLGGWVSTHYAAVACGTSFPTCHGTLWPDADFAQGFAFAWEQGRDYEFGILENHARTAIHLTHRAGALVVFLVLGAIVLWAWWRKPLALGRLPEVLLFFLCLQVSLGILNVVWALPLAVAVGHNLVAALLLLTVIAFNQRLYGNRELRYA